jgi:hypothetical protein
MPDLHTGSAHRSRMGDPRPDLPPPAPMYYAASAGQQLNQAQAVLDLHVTSAGTGRCVACDSPGPCWRRESAVAIFSRSLRLPARRPGASHPELINARRVSPHPLPLAS